MSFASLRWECPILGDHTIYVDARLPGPVCGGGGGRELHEERKTTEKGEEEEGRRTDCN